MTRKMSMQILSLEEAAERGNPTVEDAFKLIPPKECAGIMYTLLEDDLLLRNGPFNGMRVSEMVKTVKGRDYVGALWKTANPEIRRVIRRYFSE